MGFTRVRKRLNSQVASRISAINSARLPQPGRFIMQNAMIYSRCPTANTAPPTMNRTHNRPSASMQAISPAAITQLEGRPLRAAPSTPTSTAMPVAAHLQAMVSALRRLG